MSVYLVYVTPGGLYYQATAPAHRDDKEATDIHDLLLTAVQLEPRSNLARLKTIAASLASGTHIEQARVEAEEDQRLLKYKSKLEEDDRFLKARDLKADKPKDKDKNKDKPKDKPESGPGLQLEVRPVPPGDSGVKAGETDMRAKVNSTIKRTLGVLLATSLLAAPLGAQQAIISGESTTNTTSPGVYLNGCMLEPAHNIATWNTASILCGILGVSSFNRLYSSAAWEVQRSATALGAGTNAAGVIISTPQEGTTLTSNISVSTVVKASAGRVFRVMVNTAGSTPGTINNTTTTGGAAAGNLLFTLPNTVGIYELQAPMSSGIVIIPGTSQVLSIVYQ